MLNPEKYMYLRFNMSNTIRIIESVKNDKVYFKGPDNKLTHLTLESLGILVNRGVITITNG